MIVEAEYSGAFKFTVLSDLCLFEAFHNKKSINTVKNECLIFCLIFLWDQDSVFE